MKKLLSHALIIAGLTVLPVSLTNAADSISVFNGSNTTGWKEKSFDGNTTYDLKSGEIHASCDGGASSFYREIEVDLNKTPTLNWSWRVDSNPSLAQGSERTKAGDDFAARIYAVVNTGTVIPNILTLNYVVSQSESKGADWANPFYSKARMVVVDGKGTAQGKWLKHSRNIKNDFKTYFGKDINEIDGIAIMTDCDNSSGQASASYGRISMSE